LQTKVKSGDFMLGARWDHWSILGRTGEHSGLSSQTLWQFGIEYSRCSVELDLWRACYTGKGERWWWQWWTWDPLSHLLR
jgi:hypothetical protein